MSIEQASAKLIASAIRQRIQSNTVRFGLLLRNLPLFDSQILYDELSTQLISQQFLLALIGFPSVKASANVSLAVTIEEAVAWRNDPSIKVPIVVILNPQMAHEKVHSLEFFDFFEDTDLRRHICAYGAETSDGDQRIMWDVLQRTPVERSIPLVAAQVLAYYIALQGGASPGEALPCLGLMRDPMISNYTSDRNGLIRRLQDNHRHVQTLLSLDKKIYRSLARAFDKDKISQYQNTFLLIQAYLRNPILENLQKLVYADVVSLFEAPKLVPGSSTSKPTMEPTQDDGAFKTVDECILEHMLNRNEDIAELEDFIQSRVQMFREDPSTNQDSYEDSLDDEKSKLILEGQELTFPLPQDKQNKHPLADSMRIWVQSDTWGGIVSRDPEIEHDLPIQRVFNDSTALKFTPFQPLKLQEEHGNGSRSLKDRFRSLDEMLDPGDNSQEKLEDLLDELHSYRVNLAAYRTLFLYEPVLATKHEAIYQLIENYVQCYNRLANRLQSISVSDAAFQYHETIELATAQFLALDVVIVDRKNNEAALLTALHPLHLWKWAELGRRLKNNSEELHQVEKDSIKEAAKHLPTILNTLLLDGKMFQPERHLAEARLVLAGEIRNPTDENSVGIPFYESTFHQLATTEGIDQLPKLIQDFLALYPPARLGFVITLIDPPTLLPILKTLASLNLHGTGQVPILQGVRVNVYRTNPEALAYDLWTMEDNEALALFRQNPSWVLHVDLMYGSYERISSKIVENGHCHITVLFDPSTTIVQPALRAPQESPNPFVIPIEVRYDSISDTVRIIQSPSSGIFESYMKVRIALTGELLQRTFGTGNKPDIKPHDLEKLMRLCQWLIVIDHPHGTLELSSIGARLAWSSTASRTLSVYTQDHKRWREHLSDHLLPFRIDLNIVEKHLLDVLTIFPDGLLSTVAVPPLEEEAATHRALLANSVEKLLGVVTTLDWYRQENPTTVLLDLDSAYFQDWAYPGNLDRTGEIEYLLAVSYRDDNFYADFIQFSIDSTPSLSEEVSRLDQLAHYASILEGLFSMRPDQLLVAPIRRERLREILSTVVFAPTSYFMSSSQHSKRTNIKAGWAEVINTLFSSYKPQIRLRSIRVAFRTNDGFDPQVHRDLTGPYPREVITLPVSLINTTLSYERI